jgi:hypothetical protein
MAVVDDDLLFGLLALQNGLIDQVQLVPAFQARTCDKECDLADHLLARRELDAARRHRGPRRLHIQKHGGVERSLAAVAAGRSTGESLARLEGTLGDSPLQVPIGQARLLNSCMSIRPDSSAQNKFDRKPGFYPGTTHCR